MKRCLCIVLSLLLAVSGLAVADEAKGLKKDIVVLFTGDIHGGAGMGLSLAAIPEVRNYYAAVNHVVLADLGDAYDGDYLCGLTQGDSMVYLMSMIGYDINTLGNHDFNFGIDKFLEHRNAYSAATVCANFMCDGKPFYPPYVIKEFDGVKVAFVGAVTPTTETTSAVGTMRDSDGHEYSFAADGTGEKLAGLVQNAVDEARKSGADYVILLSHLGRSESDSPYTCKELIAKTSGIDAVLDGHSHDTEKEEYLDKEGKPVPRQACGTKMEGIGWLRIGKDGKLTTGLHHWTNGVSAQDLLNLRNDIAFAVMALDELVRGYSEVKIGETKHDLCIADENNVAEDGSAKRIVRNRETNLGDLIADAYREYANADIGVVQGGGVRERIAEGDITLNDLSKVMPFMNNCFLCEVTGQELLDMLEISVHALPDEFGGFLQVSGLTFDVRTDIPSGVVLDEKKRFVRIDEGERRVRNVKVHGEPLDVTKRYKIAGPDTVLLKGMDGYPVVPGRVQLLAERSIDVNVVEHYIKVRLKGVVGDEYKDPYGQGRINILAGKTAAGTAGQPDGEKKAA